MANPLELPSPNINPGVIGGGGLAPNPIDLFLASYIDAKKQKSNESAQAREFEIQKAHLDLEKQRQKIILSQQEHAQVLEQEKGKAVQAVLKMLGPGVEQFTQTTGQLPQFLGGGPIGGQQPQGSPLAMQVAGRPAQAPMQAPSPVSAPAQATPSQAPNWGAVVAGMSDEGAASFVHEDLPQLLALQKGLNPQQQGQAVQTGDTVTTFVPGKGFWDAKQNKWVPSIERHMGEDEKTIKMLQIQESRERIAAMQAYRVATQAQSQTRQFNMRTKDLQQRGAIINQALQTISDAANNPDPQQRKILYSSAIANFVQAADQKAQIRYQLLQYFKNNIDPSISGKWNVLRTRMLQGTLPAYASQGMIHHLTNLLQLTGTEYDKQRSAEVRRHPELGNWLPEKDEFFMPLTVNQQQSPDLAPPP